MRRTGTLVAAYLEGDKSGIPADKLIIVPTKVRARLPTTA